MPIQKSTTHRTHRQDSSCWLSHSLRTSLEATMTLKKTWTIWLMRSWLDLIRKTWCLYKREVLRAKANFLIWRRLLNENPILTFQMTKLGACSISGTKAMARSCKVLRRTQIERSVWGDLRQIWLKTQQCSRKWLTKFCSSIVKITQTTSTRCQSRWKTISSRGSKMTFFWKWAKSKRVQTSQSSLLWITMTSVRVKSAFWILRWARLMITVPSFRPSTQLQQASEVTNGRETTLKRRKGKRICVALSLIAARSRFEASSWTKTLKMSWCTSRSTWASFIATLASSRGIPMLRSILILKMKSRQSLYLTKRVIRWTASCLIKRVDRLTYWQNSRLWQSLKGKKLQQLRENWRSLSLNSQSQKARMTSNKYDSLDLTWRISEMEQREFLRAQWWCEVVKIVQA